MAKSIEEQWKRGVVLLQWRALHVTLSTVFSCFFYKEPAAEAPNHLQRTE